MLLLALRLLGPSLPFIGIFGEKSERGLPTLDLRRGYHGLLSRFIVELESLFGNIDLSGACAGISIKKVQESIPDAPINSREQSQLVGGLSVLRFAFAQSYGLLLCILRARTVVSCLGEWVHNPLPRNSWRLIDEIVDNYRRYILTAYRFMIEIIHARSEGSSTPNTSRSVIKHMHKKDREPLRCDPLDRLSNS